MCSVGGSFAQFRNLSDLISRLTYVNSLLKEGNQQKNLNPNLSPSLNQNNSVHTCKLFLTWMIAVLGLAASAVGSCVCPEN